MIMTELDQWKLNHGIDPTRPVNHDELAMAVEDLKSTKTSWCMYCDREMPVKEMRIITRATDPYVQIQEDSSEYIRESNRVRACPDCYARQYSKQ